MNERERIEILERLDQLEWQVELLDAVHRRLLSEVKKQNKLIEEMIEDSKDNWWKEGPDTEC